MRPGVVPGTSPMLLGFGRPCKLYVMIPLGVRNCA